MSEGEEPSRSRYQSQVTWKGGVFCLLLLKLTSGRYTDFFFLIEELKTFNCRFPFFF